nr:hypothetical protein CFP56_72596 [Quercus suber]
MDDVDLLFECFKCGASPPQSAFRERKRRKNKLKLGSSTQEVSTSPDIPSSGSAGQRPKKAKDVQLSIEKFDTATVKLKANKKNPGNQFSPISSRKEIWATFPRQDEAMKFLVSTYKEFWQRYKNMDSKFHHHYEVIQEMIVEILVFRKVHLPFNYSHTKDCFQGQLTCRCICCQDSKCKEE